MQLALTVDVEDWYDGMAELGHPIERPQLARSGLDMLVEMLSGTGNGCRVTFFVVGNYAGHVRPYLEELVDQGHEIASHGPHHGAVPATRGPLEEWLRQGRETLEQLIQRPVTGFRSPRFDVPAEMTLHEYRESLARAGYQYVSDTRNVGSSSAVRELPVLARWRIPVGGGSYQRLLPRRLLGPLLDGAADPKILYYHSYDFGATLPSPWSHPSPAVLKQVAARNRIPAIFRHLLRTAGSISCTEASCGP